MVFNFVSDERFGSSLSIRPSYGARGEEILDGGGGFPSPLFLFRFHFSPFPQKRLILRLLWEASYDNRIEEQENKIIISTKNTNIVINYR